MKNNGSDVLHKEVVLNMFVKWIIKLVNKLTDRK